MDIFWCLSNLDKSTQNFSTTRRLELTTNSQLICRDETRKSYEQAVKFKRKRILWFLRMKRFLKLINHTKRLKNLLSRSRSKHWDRKVFFSFHQHGQMMCAQGQVVNAFPVWSLNAWSQKQSFPVPVSQERLEISKKLRIYQIGFVLLESNVKSLKIFKLRKTVICQVREKFHTRQPVFSDAVKDLELCHQWVLRETLLKLGKFIFIASDSAGWLVKIFFLKYEGINS